MKVQTVRKTAAESDGFLYNSRKMSVKLTTRKSAIYDALARKTAAKGFNDMVFVGKTDSGSGHASFHARCRRAVIGGSVTGAIAALAICVCFGILDIQCRNDPAGRYWNAAEQRCQQHEVGRPR